MIIKSPRIFYQSNSILSYANYDHLNKKLTYYALDFTNNLALHSSKIIDFHDCQTIPASGNGEIHVPYHFFSYLSEYFLVFFTTGTGSTCSNVLGKYYLYKIPLQTPLTFTDTLPSQGVTAFFQPNSLGMGLSTFSGYTKVVDTMTTIFNSKPYICTMVYYEQT